MDLMGRGYLLIMVHGGTRTGNLMTLRRLFLPQLGEVDTTLHKTIRS